MIVEIFIPIAEHILLIGMPANEANAETETQLLTVETKIRKVFKVI